MTPYNMSANTDPQQQEAASPQVLRAGCLRRWAYMWQRINPSRAATDEEIAVVEAALRLAPTQPIGPQLFEQLRFLTVVGECECGGPSVDFVPSEEENGPGILADTMGESEDGVRVGIIVWGHPDRVTNLEVYSASDPDRIPMPRPEHIDHVPTS